MSESAVFVELSRLRGAPPPVVEWLAPFVLQQVKPPLEVLDPEKLAEYQKSQDWWVWGWRVWNLDG